MTALIKLLQNDYISSSIHPNAGESFAYAIQKLSTICGPYFKIYGINCALDLSLGFDLHDENNGKKLYLFRTNETSQFNKNWNNQENDGTTESAIQELSTFCKMLKLKDSHVEIKITESAEIILKELDSRCMYNASKTKDILLSEQWESAHLKTLKLCGIYAVSNGFYSPLVTEKIAIECVKVVEQSIAKLWLHSKESGKSKLSTEEEQQSQIFALLRKKLKLGSIVTRSYMQRRLSNCAPFRNDITGPKEAIYKCIGYLCSDGVLSRVLEDSPRAAVKYKINEKFFL